MISRVAVPPNVDGTAPGFNLGGRDTAFTSADDCRDYDLDFVSSSTGERGVDNTFSGALGQTLAAVLGDLTEVAQETVISGRSIVVIELSDVNDFVDDSRVLVSIHEGRVRGELLIDGDAIAADQSFNLFPVGRRYLRGSIRGGVLDV